MEKFREVEKTESLSSFHGYTYPKSVVSGLTGDSHSIDEGYAWERQTDSTFQWKSRWQNTMFFLSTTLSWTSFTTYDRGEKNFPMGASINFLQFVFVYVFLGFPMVFLETFIGQFARKGCLVIGQMMPVANGLGYLILINTLFNAIFNLCICGILLFYVLLALANFPVPAWMLCLSSYLSVSPNCIGRREIDLCESCESPKAAAQGPCFDPTRHNLSSYLFVRTVVLKFDNRHRTQLDPPDAKLGIHLAVTVLLLFITILRDVRDLDTPIKIWNMFAVISLAIMTVVISFSSMRFKGFLYFFSFTWKSVIDINCWTETVKKVIVCLNISEGSHILFGSFTPITTNTSHRCIFLCLVKFGVFVLFHTFLFILRENFLCKVNAGTAAISGFSITSYILAVYPGALGTLASAPFWGFLYFVIAFNLSFQAVIVQILTIETSISQVAFKTSYRFYIRCITLVITFVGALLLITPQGAHSASLFYAYISLIRIAVVFLCLIVTFTYGFQRFYDDIHFLLRYPPSCFYRYSWFVSLVLSGMSFLVYLINGKFRERKVVFYVILIALMACLLLGFILKFVVCLRAKDLSSLFSPAEVWGPSDQESRTVRRLFNPRYEVRFRRRVEWCNHRSLVGSMILKRTLEGEVALLSNVLLEIEDNEEGRKLKKDLIDAIRMQRALLSKVLAKRAQGEVAITFNYGK